MNKLLKMYIFIILFILLIINYIKSIMQLDDLLKEDGAIEEFPM